MKKILTHILAALVLLSGSPAFGQSEPLTKLLSDMPGGLPLMDTVSLGNIRTRLAEISARRPSVAIVLCGGGAKGASHVGVLRYLESLGIPVDVVLGTSMGGLVGGMYALGYSVDEMEDIIGHIDWNSAMTDKVPRSYISYKDNKYKEKFILSIPFHYAQDKSQKDSLSEDKRYDKLHLSADSEDAAATVKKAGGFPSGFVYGQNVYNLLSSLTIGYQGDTDFSKLPVPFVCVATEMVTGKAKIWSSGDLNIALRSTMSIPGVFAPVRRDGMVLVDGGMRDNYPADIARVLGADIVIGVNLSDEAKTYDKVNSLMDIISQGVGMLSRESYEKSLKLVDVEIKPFLPDFNMMSFDPRSIDIIMKRGLSAAQEQEKKLLEVKEKVGGDTKVLLNKKAVNAASEKVTISSIEVDGVSSGESRYLLDKLNISLNDSLGRKELDDAVATVFGTKAFDYVTYELLGDCEPYRLKINCKKGPVHQLGFGGRIDTEEIVSLLLNYGINTHKLRGSALDITGKISVNPSVSLHYYYMGSKGPALNISTKFHYVDKNNLNIGNAKLKAAYTNLKTDLYVSNMRWSKFDLQFGLRNDFFDVNSLMADKISVGDYDHNAIKNDFMAAFLGAYADTFDDGYFPTKGLKFSLDYAYTFAGLKHKITPFNAVRLDIKGAIHAGSALTILPFANIRMLFCKDDVPLSYMNVAGGRLAGRYFDQQIPFAGFNNAFATNNIMAIAGADFRFNLFKNNYLTATFNAMDTFDEMSNIGKGDSNKAYYGAALQYAYDTIIGPIKADIHWSNINKKVGAYLSIGFDF